MESSESEMKDEHKKTELPHLILFAVLFFLAFLILGGVSIIVAFALRDKTPYLIVSLILIHAVELVSVLAFYFQLLKIEKNYLKKRGLRLILSLILLIILVLFIALEAYMLN